MVNVLPKTLEEFEFTVQNYLHTAYSLRLFANICLCRPIWVCCELTRLFQKPLFCRCSKKEPFVFDGLVVREFCLSQLRDSRSVFLLNRNQVRSNRRFLTCSLWRTPLRPQTECAADAYEAPFCNGLSLSQALQNWLSGIASISFVKRIMQCVKPYALLRFKAKSCSWWSSIFAAARASRRSTSSWVNSTVSTKQMSSFLFWKTKRITTTSEMFHNLLWLSTCRVAENWIALLFI